MFNNKIYKEVLSDINCIIDAIKKDIPSVNDMLAVGDKEDMAKWYTKKITNGEPVGEWEIKQGILDAVSDAIYDDILLGAKVKLKSCC